MKTPAPRIENAKRIAFLITRTVAAMRKGDYTIFYQKGDSPGYDLLATKPRGFGVRRIAINCGGDLGTIEGAATDALSAGTEYWYVDYFVSDSTRRHMGSHRAHARALTIEELEEFVAPAKTAKVRTRIAAAILANPTEILLAAEGLARLIDEKLMNLRGAPPNSDEAITAWRTTLSDYERLRAQVLELKEAVHQFSVSPARSKKVETKANAFGRSMSKWLEKDAGAVLTKTANVGVFCIGALICTLLGVAPEVAVGVTAWVVTGKRPSKAAKKLTKAAAGGS